MARAWIDDMDVHTHKETGKGCPHAQEEGEGASSATGELRERSGSHVRPTFAPPIHKASPEGGEAVC